MKRSVKTLLTLVLALVFLFSTVQYLKSRQEKAQGNSTYEEALTLAVSTRQDVSQPTPVTETPAAEPQWVAAPVWWDGS